MPLSYVKAEIYMLKEQLRIMDAQNLSQTEKFKVKQAHLRQVVDKYLKAKLLLEEYFDMCSKSSY